MKRAAPTAQNDSSNLRRRAAEADLRRGKDRVVAAMKSHPDCIRHLESTLDSLGYFDRRSETSLPQSKHAAAMQARKQSTAKASAERRARDISGRKVRS